MGALQVLELVLLAFEKGPEVVRKVRDAFANQQEPTAEDIIKKLNEMEPPFDPDDFPLDPEDEL